MGSNRRRGLWVSKGQGSSYRSLVVYLLVVHNNTVMEGAGRYRVEEDVTENRWKREGWKPTPALQRG